MKSTDNNMTVNFNPKFQQQMPKLSSTEKNALSTMTLISYQHREIATDAGMRTMLVTLDENLAQAHVEFLRQVGYNAERIPEAGLSGADDDIVWQRVCGERRFFITLDKDFSDVRRFIPGTHPGILLLRPHSCSRKAVLKILSRVVDEYQLENLRGCFVVANDKTTRIHRPQ